MLRYTSHILFSFFRHRVSATLIPQTRCFSAKRLTRSTNLNDYLKSQNLSNQQQSILKAITETQSVFISGPAGTGKSYVVSLATELLRRKIYQPYEVFVTASTGVSACALNGQTLHSFAGIGLGEGEKEVLLKKVLKNGKACSRWRTAKALVIDEISMIECDLFEKIEYIARNIRGAAHRNKPWGGIQLIVSGDFFQLPPIMKEQEHLGKEFAFEATCWEASFDLQVELTQIFRQTDLDFINLLQRVRRGQKDEHHLELLHHCCNVLTDSSESVPSLFPRNKDVNRVNEGRLRRLGNETFKYTARDSGKQPWKGQLKLGIAPDELEICIDARVMLIKNKDLRAGLVNGATGTVVDFVEAAGKKHSGICTNGLLPKVRFDSGLVAVINPETWEVTEGEVKVATRRQIPLILAWAVTIHKCQGMTLECLHTDLSRAFGYGMVYVALSRVRSLKGLYLSGFTSSKIKAHPKVLEFYDKAFCS
ncbi:Atp-dependent dna helicase [Thalictrum thalictroides]|uniref:ATP-dependent DNA helicase n=1 Tax=Thalictrum thalictroides TaxID=46969 RepID=A0A7J6WYD3_THATH|nr:Atp-dependent dna helicase [Thalictrum thalictroides]